MPRKYSRRRRSSKKKITKRSKSKKIRGGVTTRNGVRRGNYRFLSTLKAQDLTRLNPDIIGEIREMHPLLTTKLNNITLRHAVKDYLSSYVKDKRFICTFNKIVERLVERPCSFKQLNHIRHIGHVPVSNFTILQYNKPLNFYIRT